MTQDRPDPSWSSTAMVDCSRYSDESGDPACEERGQSAVGLLVLLGVLVLAVGYLWWRRASARVTERDGRSTTTDPDGDP